MKEIGEYTYIAGDNIFKGVFNIYQAKHGGIILLMNTKVTVLSISQINDLSIDCYSLLDFNIDTFKKYYNKAFKLTDIEIEEKFSYARSLTDYGAQIGAKWAREQYETRIKQ